MSDTVEWYAWLVRDGDQWWAGCRRLDSDCADFMVGPSPDATLLRSRVAEYALDCEEFHWPRRKPVVRWQGDEAARPETAVMGGEDDGEVEA